MTASINNEYLDKEENGLLQSFKEQESCVLTPALSRNFFASNDDRDTRARLEQPTILGHFGHFTYDKRDIRHNSITIKNSKSWDIALPECFAFAFPMAQAVSEDLLQIYGHNNFLKLQIQFMAERSNIEPLQAGRNVKIGQKNARDWHTDSNPAFSYIISNELPTEFRTTAGELHTDRCALTRFGPRAEHRAIVNDTNRPLRRTYGMFMASANPRLIHQITPSNAGQTSRADQRAAFSKAAHNYMSSPENTYTPLPRPKILGEDFFAAPLPEMDGPRYREL